MLIKATTKIDYATYREYYIFNFMQGRRSPWQPRLLIALPPLMAAAFLLLLLKDPADIVNLIGLILSVAFGLILALVILVMPRGYYRNVEKILSIPVHFTFSEDSFEVRTESLKQAEPAGMNYERLYKAYETPRFYYLYLSANRPLILGKGDFSAGTAEDLRQLLVRKIGRRFQMTRSVRKSLQR
jgi:hypothetical protein